ncbi:MAG: hypothetical protein JWQ36_1920 [Enterovirga sp.]|nr:hypothetical protein [Enterovirga sp.]
MTTTSAAVLNAPGMERVIRLRTILKLAGRENSRMVAATIGGHLQAITIEAPKHPALVDAADAVRDASLGFLTSLHGRGDVATARHQVLNSVDRLEACLSA